MIGRLSVGLEVRVSCGTIDGNQNRNKAGGRAGPQKPADADLFHGSKLDPDLSEQKGISVSTLLVISTRNFIGIVLKKIDKRMERISKNVTEKFTGLYEKLGSVGSKLAPAWFLITDAKVMDLNSPYPRLSTSPIKTNSICDNIFG
jgi:hypothetical protein